MVGQGHTEMLVYVGTYTRRGSEGIYVYRLDLDSGALDPISIASGVVNPSFLAIAPRKHLLYAVNEVDEVAGKRSGAVSAFSIDQKTGQLTLLNQQPTEGTGPCYVSVDTEARFALAANYAGGSVCVLPIDSSGSLLPAADFVQHHGSSIDPRRQNVPHAHCIVLDPAERFALVPDLGQDKVMIYRFDATTGQLTPNDPPWAQLAPGAGPRHFTFHPNGSFGYVINEIGSTVTAFAYDASRGSLSEVQTVSTLPDDFAGTSHCADVHVAPSGKFLYGSNRGHDSIAIFSVDEDSGKLSLIGHEPTQGEIPRNFAIDPTGAFLLAANQNSDSIVSFRIDQETGALDPTGHATEVSMPVCVKILPLRASEA